MQPAFETYQWQQLLPHFAVHAITQFDVLAEVTAIHCGIESRKFRRELGRREPILIILEDVHDCHKHGVLKRRLVERLVSRGQRPEITTDTAFFVGHTFPGRELTEYDHLTLELDDGSTRSIYGLLYQARAFWLAELDRLGL